MASGEESQTVFMESQRPERSRAAHPTTSSLPPLVASMSWVPSIVPLVLLPSLQLSLPPSNVASTPPAAFVMPVWSVVSAVHTSVSLPKSVLQVIAHPGVLPATSEVILSLTSPFSVISCVDQGRFLASTFSRVLHPPSFSTVHSDRVHFVSSSTAPGPTDPSPVSLHSTDLTPATVPSLVSFTVPFHFVATAVESSAPACRHSGATTSSLPPLVASMSWVPSIVPLVLLPSLQLSLPPSNVASTPPAAFVMPVLSVVSVVHTSVFLPKSVLQVIAHPGVLPATSEVILSLTSPFSVISCVDQGRFLASTFSRVLHPPSFSTVHSDRVHFVSSSTAPGPTDPSPVSLHSTDLTPATVPSSVSFTVPFHFVATAVESSAPACRHSGATTSSLPPLVASMSWVPSIVPLVLLPSLQLSLPPSNVASTPPA